MELSWLDDFLTLSRTLNFSKAAELRNTTQPTFSRRIRNLELWLGAALVDRSVFPAALTEEGRSFGRVAQEVSQLLHRERDRCRSASRPRRASLSFSMIQSLAVSFFPDWIGALEEDLGPLRARATCSNVHDCVQSLVSGTCDVMLCYVSPAVDQVRLDEGHYGGLRVGDEVLLPITAVNGAGGRLHDLDRADGKAVAYLAYAKHALLGRMVDSVLLNAPNAPVLDACFESAFAAALKAMVVAGRGIAWLPRSIVEAELGDGRLLQAGAPRWSLPMEIRAYRAWHRGTAEVGRLWQCLEDRGVTS